MGRRGNDLIGQRFGCMVVVARVQPPRDAHTHWWKWKCTETGKSGVRDTSSLRRHPPECPHQGTYKRFKVRVGQSYGNLRVLSNNGRQYLCECKMCGTQYTKTSRQLYYQHSHERCRWCRGKFFIFGIPLTTDEISSIFGVKLNTFLHRIHGSGWSAEAAALGAKWQRYNSRSV